MADVLMQPLTSDVEGAQSSSVKLSTPVKAALAGLVVFSVLAISAVIALSILLTRGGNVSHIPAQFTGQVVVTTDDSMYTDASTSTPASTAVHIWTVDRINNQEQTIMSQGSDHELLVYTNGDNAYQMLVSSSADPTSNCYMYPLSQSHHLHDFSAVSTTPAGTVVVDGVTCDAYIAVRADKTRYGYSINPANGAVCQITYASKVYTFKTFSTQISIASTECAPGTYANPASANERPVILAAQGVSPRSIFHDVWNYAKCHTCEDVAHWVIETAADGGCGLLSDGLAAEICGEAVDAGCEIADCDSRICGWIHMC